MSEGQVRTMIILEDTRQQETRHKKKHDYFNSVGVRWTRTTLFCGDYTLPTNQSICVDTKQNMAEIINDINVKSLTKREITETVNQIRLTGCIDAAMADDLIHIIYDDDSDRYPEDEISELLHRNGVEGYLIKCKIMEKVGKSNKCVKEVLIRKNYTQSDIERVIDEFKVDKTCMYTLKYEKIRIEDALQDLYVGRRGFFHRGLKRAQKHNVKLYILIENEDGIKSIEDVFKWQNPRIHRYNKIAYMHNIGKWQNIPLPKSKPTTGDTLAKAMITMEKKYGVTFCFCNHIEAGERVLSILNVKQEE